jgi:polar amino acid transport system substrate-binding protein
VPVTRRRPSIALAATAAVLLLAGCGAGGDGSGDARSPEQVPPPVAADDALAAQVPAAVAEDGRLVFGTDASYPPNEFVDTDGTTIIGLDVDLGTAVAQRLGLQAQFVNSSFDGILPGIAARTYELGMSSFSITDERVQAVDMVSYFTAGTRLATAAGNPLGLTAENLCGRSVGVQRGTVQVDDLSARSQACTAAGQPAVAVSEFQLQTDVNLALASGRIVAMLADAPVVAYAEQTTGGSVEAAGDQYDSAPYGIALAKEQGAFAEAARGAVQSLIDDGTYAAILEKWNVADGAIPTSEVRS